MNISLVAGVSEGGECANCFSSLRKGEPCLRLEIKKVKILGVIPVSKVEEICVLCEVSLLDEHGRAHVELGKMTRKTAD